MADISSKPFIAKLADVHAFQQSSRAMRRITISAEVMRTAGICAGDTVAICNVDGFSSQKSFAVGEAWPSERLAQDTILLSNSLFLTVCPTAGAMLNIFPLNGLLPVVAAPKMPSLGHVPEAGLVQMKEILLDTFTLTSSKRSRGRDWLTLALKETLGEYLVYEGRTRQFSLMSVSGHLESEKDGNDLAPHLKTLSMDASFYLWIVGWTTSVAILEVDAVPANDGCEEKARHESITPSAYASIGGLEKQISQIRDLLEIPLTHPDLFRRLGLKAPRGILLHGPPGTGKTHLARSIASSVNACLLIVNGPELSSAYHGETEAKLRAVFKEAQERSPCIVVLDEVDALVPKREEGPGGEVEKRVVATLLTIMDGMEDVDYDKVVVIGTTNRPNAIDVALRRPGRFDREIEIGVPNIEARCAILNVMLSKIPHTLSDADIQAIARRAYGYVGADLAAVVREAGILAIKRHLNLYAGQPPAEEPSLKPSDLLSALPGIRPSAMRSIFLDTPPVRYSEIGGQAHAIQQLREAIEWPLLRPEMFARLGVKIPKGVLMYGPPGCSKTLLARACAFESGVNFVAVRGPEILNKFLGESERALREIFQKAKAVSPSILFFDEIDAIAASRSHSSSSSTAGPHEGTLTTLLNEMDGVQQLVGVAIVAATNRPDIIDPALIRPGRLDRIMYVGPPDQTGRTEILKIHMKSMKVGPGVDVDEIAFLTDGCTGAELASICQEAALLSLRKDQNASYVSRDAFLAAAKSVEKQTSLEMTQRYEKWRSAYVL